MRTIRQGLVFVVLCLVLPGVGYAQALPVATPAEVGMSAQGLARVVPAVEKLITDEKIAGASIVVARKGKIAFAKTFGMMDIEAKKPVESDTIFRFYSMTKPVTSVAVMMLYDASKLKLDDPVSEYVPQFGNLKVYHESGEHKEPFRAVTVRDLLRHTSGLTYGFFGDTAVDKMYQTQNVFDREASLQEMAGKLGKIPLLYQPGTKWHYSVSTDVLGFLVEQVSGQPLDEFFRMKIFEPLGMKDTAFYVPTEKVDRFATCYGPNEGSGLRVTDKPAESRYLSKPALLSGGGGLVSTAGDYIRFCQMLVNKGQLDGIRLLKRETVEMMTRNQLPNSVTRDGQGFGLGFSVQIKPGNAAKGEYGWGGMASTHFWISPTHELAVVALSQRYPYSGQLENAVKSIIYEAIIE